MFSFASITWIFCSVWMLMGFLFMTYQSLVPKFVLNLYTYGKLKGAALKSGGSFMVPKSYFSHFYLGGIFFCSGLLGLTWYVLCGGGDWPETVQTVIHLMRYPVKESYGDLHSLFIVLVCADIQVTRRFLECKLVSVYSPGNYMSFIIYLVGVTFYAALPLTSLCGTDLTGVIKCEEFLQNLRWNHFVGVGLFIWSSWKQNETAHLFAKLRQNKTGTVENTRHHIPHGGLFEYISCPHYFTEILIYLAFNLMFLFKNTMLIWLFVFVVTNQVITGYLSHKWYLENFKKYPKSRKAVIPFLF